MPEELFEDEAMSYREKTKTTTVTIRVCDRCGRDTCHTRAVTGYVCRACGRDVCWKCSTFDDSKPGDNQPSFCNECWDIGKPAREYMQKLKEISDVTCEKMKKLWYALCEQVKP